MKRPLRLVHASDVHLDTDVCEGGPLGGADLALRDRYRSAFAALLEYARGLAPDLMLLPGDLFDSNRATHDTVLWSMAALAGLPFPVVMIPGNHDCLEPGAIYDRYDFPALPNLTLLRDPAGEAVHLPALQAQVWGRGMVQHCPEFRPLAGLPAARRERWNLALGHGIYLGDATLGGRSSPVLPSEIAASGYDYIALGHHHALRDVSANGTAAWYSGAPVAIVPGDTGTLLLVELEEGHLPRVTVHRLEAV